MNFFKILSTFFFLMVFSTISLAAGSSEKDIEAVKKVLKDYGESNLAGDAKSWAELHAIDVVKMPPDKPAITSREALYEGKVKKFAKTKVVGWNLEAKEVEIMGDRAYTWGVYKVEVEVLKTGGIINVDGKFLTIYRKEADGSWVITHDCFNSNIPPKK